MTFLRISLFSLLLFLQFPASSAQSSLKKQKKYLLLALGTGYVSAYTYLGFNWYSQFRFSQFHFFNDLREWKQMDKFGHAYGAFQESRLLTESFRALGDSSAFWMFSGFFLQLPIEILDGFSLGWGASAYDLLGNALGSTLLFANYKIFNEERISLKFSFHPTQFAEKYPRKLGKSLNEQIFKDYNGQTYWLVYHPRKTLLSYVAPCIGIGAEGLIGNYGIDPDYLVKQREYRQYYLSLDFRFSAIPTRKKFLKTFFFVLDALKMPAPTMEFSRKGSKFYFLYF